MKLRLGLSAAAIAVVVTILFAHSIAQAGNTACNPRVTVCEE